MSAEPYEAFYAARDPKQVYPVEFVVRAFLGSYPRLPRAAVPFRGRVLDLGCGDGRNMPLLADLGLRVFGAEVSADIASRTMGRLARLGVDADIRVGRNTALPFEDGFFDHVLACHSCYYVDRGTQFADNVREMARVMKPAARLVFSAPMADSYIMHGARDLGEGHMEIANDPYGVRHGAILKKFDSEEDIERALGEFFADVRIGSCRNDFWGIEERVWTVVCHRRGNGDAS